MKQAILIMAHKNLLQIERLVNRIGNEFDIFLHLDKKMKIEYNHLSLLLSKFDNLHLTKNRISGVVYAWPRVEITIELIKTAKEIECQKDYFYSHYILLSGQDYVLKLPSDIKTQLEEFSDVNFIDINSGSEAKLISSLSKRIRFARFYYIVEKLTKNKFLRRLFLIPLYVIQEIITFFLGAPKKIFLKYEFKVYGGSAWWILTKESIEIILKFIENSALKNSPQNKITTAYKRTIGPEESFFQSVLMNSKDSKNLKFSDKENWKYIDWGVKNGKPTPPGGHPYILLTSDYNDIINSKAMFARKFDMDVDSHILDLLDKSQ